MARSSRAARGALVLVAAMAACTDTPGPLAPGAGPGPAGLRLQAVECRADVRAGRVECDDAPAGSAARANVIVGGNHRYVTLASSGVAYDAPGETFSFDVTVANGIPQPMATADGAAADPSGVRVFFHGGPAATELADPSGPSEVEVIPDGWDVFTASSQPYYAYAGAVLGPDGLLSPGEVSAARRWALKVPANVVRFAFTVLVWTTVPHPAGYVEVAPVMFSAVPGDSLRLSATVRSALGDALGDQAVAWSTSDPAVATVDAGGMVTVRAAGTVTISAAQGARTGAAAVRSAGGAGGPRYRAVSAGEEHACAVAEGGAAYCWGAGPFGELGDGQFHDWSVRPVRVAGEAWDTVVAGSLHSCGLRGGAAWCWGADTWGGLGTGAVLQSCPSPMAGGPGCSAVPLPVAGGHAFARLTVGGQHLRTLGPPYSSFACGFTAAGAGWCWGGDGAGELGDGAQYPLDNPTPLPMAGGIAFAQAAAGMDNSCGVDFGGRAYCWGSERAGELGNDTRPNTPGLDDVITPPQPVLGGLVFRQMDTGVANSCGVTTAGEVWCWGSNTAGALGTAQPVTECGTDPRYPLPCSRVPVRVSSPLVFSQVTVGSSHACALTTDGQAWCWGRGVSLGAGDPESIPGSVPCAYPGDPSRCVRTPVRVGTTVRFRQLDASVEYTCGVSTGGAIYCWGRNIFGLARDGNPAMVPQQINSPAS